MELTEKTLLSFRLDPLGFDPYDQELEVVRNSLLAQLGLKRHGVWLDLDLGSPEVSRVVAQVEAWVRVGVAEIGQASLNTRCAPDTEWVQLLPRQRSLDIEPEKCRAFRLPKVDIVGQQYRDTVFVSERFRQFCVDHRLGGLDFQWVPDRGKFRAQQWFLPLLLENLGRGLDDPWFCPETLAGPGQDQPDTPTERFGIHRFYGWQWCRPEGNRLLNLLPVGSGLETTQLCLPPRVRAEDLPDRPFACLWSRRESLCCNQVTYQLLLGAGLLAEVEAEGIVVAQGDALGCAASARILKWPVVATAIY